MLKRTKRRPRRVAYDEAKFRQRAITLALLALGLTLFVELCNRGLSVPRLFRFITGAPVVFLCNCMIVLTSLVFSELFRRRRAVLGTMCLVWVLLGVVQFMVARDRTTPFSSMDLLLVKEAFSLITIYCTWGQIVAMFLGVFLLFALIITLFTRAKRRRNRNLPRALVAFVGCVLLCVMTAAIGVSTGFFPQRFDSLVDNYADYGFPLVFTYTFGQMGIARPKDYSDEAMGEILEHIENETDTESEHYPAFGEDDNLAHPNILFVQLESFIDIDTIRNCEVSRSPTPFFNPLRFECPSGLLYVPTVGGGTVNTEFEIITGLNLDYFGAGESPYSTILQQSTCESVAFNLKENGYTATAMHNNGATFYNRNIVYPMMGFDCFVPIEYMQNVRYNALGWATDDVLTDEIMTVLKGTEGRDMVLCITVESHGKYSDVYEPQPGDIEVLSLPEEIPLAPFQNYVNVLRATDAFLGRLIVELMSFEEPTVVVAYGDHLPALELTADLLTTDSIYATQYVIWNNFGHKFEAPDMQAYRLSAHLLSQLGMSGGVITRLHQSADPTDESEEYLARLEMLEYDVFYGDQQAFDGESPYAPTDMRLGSRTIAVSGADMAYHRLLVTGEGFNEFSRIVLDGQLMDTLFVDSEHVVARVQQSDNPIGTQTEALTFDEVAVAQVNSDGVELSRTAPYRAAPEED